MAYLFFKTVEDFLRTDIKDTNDVWVFPNTNTKEKAFEIVSELVDKDKFFASACESYGSKEKFFDCLMNGNRDGDGPWATLFEGPVFGFLQGAFTIDFTAF